MFTGDVVTMDPALPRAGALAVADDTILAVGEAGALTEAFPGARVEELEGTVVPGLVDSHLHLQWTGLKLLRLLGSAGPLDVDEALAALDADGDAAVWPDGEPTLDERVAAIARGQELALALGLTGVVDPAVTPPELVGYVEARRRGVLTLRVVAMPHVLPGADHRFDALGLRTGFGDDVLRLGPVKIYYDGQGRAGTALLRAPWPASGTHGVRLVDQETFRRLALRCARARWGVGVHVVGGAGIGEVLEAFAAVDAAAPIAGLGFTLIHAYLEPTSEDMALAARLGVTVAAQPAIQWMNGGGLLDALGDRARDAAPLRDWLDAGVVVGGGSDGPYFPLDPRLGLYQARTRRVRGAADPVGPGQALDGQAALGLYTRGSAAVAGDARRGVLAAGSRADLAVWSVDPTACAPDELLGARVLRTVVGGQTVGRMASDG